jgi:hypothetical protein
MGNYIGPGPQATDQKQYFYGLRRDDAGNLYFTKVDLSSNTDTVSIVDLTLRGSQKNQYEFPGIGSDFFDGRKADHTLVDPSLKYEQFKWDTENVYYFLNAQGQMVLRVNNGYTYS